MRLEFKEVWKGIKSCFLARVHATYISLIHSEELLFFFDLSSPGQKTTSYSNPLDA
ncbi:hypothetical protein CP061683_0078 [Chlamydia psittaci 06-1683]|nr:hypothetical protein CP061683_0078 [Chlamydia psittaci 06-1683]